MTVSLIQTGEVEVKDTIAKCQVHHFNCLIVNIVKSFHLCKSLLSLSVTPHLTVALFTQNCATQAAILHDGIVKYFKYCPTVNLRTTTCGTMHLQSKLFSVSRSGRLSWVSRYQDSYKATEVLVSYVTPRLVINICFHKERQ